MDSNDSILNDAVIIWFDYLKKKKEINRNVTKGTIHTVVEY